MSFSRVFFGVIVLHFLLVISEADLQAINNDPADIKQFKNITSTLNSYKAGIGDLLSNIPDDYQDQRDNLFILSVLKGSVYDHLYWGMIKPNNTMVTFSKGHTNGCWAMIIQKDHPILQKRGPTYETLKSDGIVHIAIRPDLISERWIGIFLIHEFTHAYKEMYGQTLSDDETEYNATNHEKIAYNYLTNDTFDEVLDSIIKDNGFSQHADYLRFVHSDFDTRNKLYLDLESKMREELPLSIAEGEMRFALFALSISLRLSEINSTKRATRISDLAEIRNQIAKF